MAQLVKTSHQKMPSVLGLTRFLDTNIADMELIANGSVDLNGAFLATVPLCSVPRGRLWNRSTNNTLAAAWAANEAMRIVTFRITTRVDALSSL